MDSEMKALLEAETDNFVALCEIAGLDPKTDLRGANLVGVDFTECDIRGFDLRDADLTRTRGTNVTWDSTTNFEGANLTGSIFLASMGGTA